MVHWCGSQIGRVGVIFVDGELAVNRHGFNINESTQVRNNRGTITATAHWRSKVHTGRVGVQATVVSEYIRHWVVWYGEGERRRNADCLHHPRVAAERGHLPGEGAGVHGSHRSEQGNWVRGGEGRGGEGGREGGKMVRNMYV